MKVLLKQDVENLGLAGEVHDVANGYGRNYLVPQGYAVVASPGVMNQAHVWRKKAEARRAQIRAEYEALARQIEGVTLTFTARAGESGKLYGSITTAQITDGLNESLGVEIDRRKVDVEPLRQLGEHKVMVRLSGEIHPKFTVRIESDEPVEVVMETAVTPEDLRETEELAELEEGAEEEAAF
jgi:large subunit ribosomal protein L9